MRLQALFYRFDPIKNCVNISAQPVTQNNPPKPLIMLRAMVLVERIA
jgi:hypothetical protein